MLGVCGKSILTIPFDFQETTMSGTTVTKVDSAHSPHGEMGQKYLASGKTVAMRLWEETPTSDPKPPAVREYETVGYVISGRAELHLEHGQLNVLEPGRSIVGRAGRTDIGH